MKNNLFSIQGTPFTCKRFAEELNIKTNNKDVFEVFTKFDDKCLNLHNGVFLITDLDKKNPVHFNITETIGYDAAKKFFLQNLKSFEIGQWLINKVRDRIVKYNGTNSSELFTTSFCYVLDEHKMNLREDEYNLLICDYEEASYAEIFNVLKMDAKRRGFKPGVFVEPEKGIAYLEIKEGKFSYDFSSDTLLVDKLPIYKNGVWKEVKRRDLEENFAPNQWLVTLQGKDSYLFYRTDDLKTGVKFQFYTITDGKIDTSISTTKKLNRCGVQKANHDEIFDMLRKVAEYKGYKEGIIINVGEGMGLMLTKIDSGNYIYDMFSDSLFLGGKIIYSKGEWKRIVETKTKNNSFALENDKVYIVVVNGEVKIGKVEIYNLSEIDKVVEKYLK